jgi:hypothetical protein
LLAHGKRAATGASNTARVTTTTQQTTQQTTRPPTNGFQPGLDADSLQGANGAAPDERAFTDANQPTGPTDAARPNGVKRHRESSLKLFATIVLATLIEGAAVYWWLRLHKEGDPWWGLGSLAAGEILETAFLTFAIERLSRKRWGLKPAERGHLRKVDRTTWLAGKIEIGIWELWLASVQWLDFVPRTQQILAAGGGLLVLMHLKHHVEVMTVPNTRFQAELFSAGNMFASAMEVAGAVAYLVLIDDGHLVLGGAALGAGLLIEHLTQISTLRWQILARDIRLPRDPRWKPPLHRRAPMRYLTTHVAPVWKLVTRIGALERCGPTASRSTSSSLSLTRGPTR